MTVGGHAPLRAESSGGRRSCSPTLVVRKRNSTVPLLEPTEKTSKGIEFTGNYFICGYDTMYIHVVLHVYFTIFRPYFSTPRI